jgi:excisionase family DNA binding protein
MDAVCMGRAQAAEALDLSLRGIDYLIARGKLRAIRVGRRVLIPRAEIERFAAVEPHASSRSADTAPGQGKLQP